MLHDVPQSSGLGPVAKFIRRRYVPWLLKPVAKGFVLVGFMGVFVLSVISIQHIQLGLGTVIASPYITRDLPPIHRSEARVAIGIISCQVLRGSGEIPGHWPTSLFRIPRHRRDHSRRPATLVRSLHHLRRLLRGKCIGIGATTTQELILHCRTYRLMDRRFPTVAGSIKGILLSCAQEQPSSILSCHGLGTTLPALFRG